MSKRLACLLLLFISATAAAEDAKAKAAREELERQLNQMVGKQPTKVRIDFIGLEDPNYRIEEASFELDGRSLRSPPLSQLSDEGTHLVWNGDVSPGKHTVKVLLVFSNGASVVLSDEGGYKWKVGGDVTFDVNSGIEVRVQVTPKRDSQQTEVAKRFKLALPAQPVMIAALDDGKMPEPPPKPILAVVDAGTPAPTGDALADQQKKDAAQKLADAAEAKRLADEAKKQKAADALAAKQAAAEAKKAKAAEALEASRAAAFAKKERAAAAAAAKKEQAAAALEAKRLAAEEKKAAALAAAEEKKAAAEEKNRLAQAALDAKKNPPPVVETPVAAPIEVDAGSVVAEAVVDAGVEVVDAGSPVVVAAAPVEDAGQPIGAGPPVEEEGEGPPWLLIGIAGGVAALFFLIVVARRRARPPTLDD
jgi:chemotaxis protein histidine kinase CheA